MKFLLELIDSAVSGWHEGKGHKSFRTKHFQKALYHYMLALKYSDKGDDAVLIECIARTYAMLGDYADALVNAKSSLALYGQLANSSPIVEESTKRVSKLIELIGSEDQDAIATFLGT